MLRRISAALLLAASCHAGAATSAQANASSPAASPPVELDRLLAYDAGRPLDVRSVGTERRDGVTVEDITWRGVADEWPAQAYVVRPSAGEGPFAAVLFVHWFAPPEPNSNRTQYLDEAKALARRGVVSLLVSTFWSDAARYRSRRWQNDYQNTITQARELRHAFDVLLARPGVDPRRIAYVGHDYGAMFGALVAGADPRPKAYAFIAGAPRFPDWYLYGSASGVPEGPDLARFRNQFAALDPVSAVARAKAAFFFQFGEDDRFTPRESFVELYMAAPTPKRIATYASGHPMDAEIIRHDRTVWLAEQLGLAAVLRRADPAREVERRGVSRQPSRRFARRRVNQGGDPSLRVGREELPSGLQHLRQSRRGPLEGRQQGGGDQELPQVVTA